MKIRAVIFDLDDTLYDERQFVKSGFRAVASYIADKYRFDMEGLYNSFLKIYAEQGRGKVFDAALRQLNFHRKDIISEMIEVYRKHTPNIRLYKDASSALSQLRKDYRLGLITDGIKHVQKEKIETLGIIDFFNVITYTHEYGRDKRSKSVFLMLLRKLGVKPEETLFIGDNPLKDFQAPKKLGIHTVRLLRGEHRKTVVSKQYDADHKVKNLRQLFQIIQKLQSLNRSRPQ